MSVSMKVPSGHKLVTRISVKIPDRFECIESVPMTGRKWWQFWLPKTICLYTVLVDKQLKAMTITEALQWKE